jgi:hypothetical protein
VGVLPGTRTLVLALLGSAAAIAGLLSGGSRIRTCEG